jgi:serine/threonine protein kinase
MPVGIGEASGASRGASREAVPSGMPVGIGEASGDGADDLLAVKCMRPQLARETRFVDMFVREGKIAVLLNHDAIVRTYEIGRIDGRYFIAMEYVSGRDLIQVLRRCQESGQRIPIPHACYIAAKMCEGLYFAHSRTDAEGRPLSIINRDVSPSNVRVSYGGEVKLLDFGIAQAALKFTSEIGVLKGKFSYMSPEQIRGMPLDARTDIFSVGIVLHEMLTTEKLFRGDTEFALMEKVRKAEIYPPSKFNRRVPPELDAIVLKALSRDLEARYQSGRELADALTKFAQTYRFEPREMQDLMRGLFRAEYDEEMREVAACRKAHLRAPNGKNDRVDLHSQQETVPFEREGESGAIQKETEKLPRLSARGEDRKPKRRGLWSRIKRKLKE